MDCFPQTLVQVQMRNDNQDGIQNARRQCIRCCDHSIILIGFF